MFPTLEGISGTAQKQNTHTSKHSEADEGHMHALGWKNGVATITDWVWCLLVTIHVNVG